MSRIDQALRRSARSAGAAPQQPWPRQDQVFESPWTFDDAPRRTADLPLHGDPAAGAGGGAAPDVRMMVDASKAFPGPSWSQWLVGPDVSAATGEPFRRLAASLLHGQRSGRLKVLMVTSAVPGEGKTLTTLNTALVLAETYRRRVLLIDADLRRPRLSEAAGLTGAEGLGEALKASDDRKIEVTQFSEYLSFLPAGKPDPQPLSGLTSARMQHLLEEAADRFDWVIVDTPPVAAGADPGLLGAIVDAIVLVIKAGQTPHPAVRHAIETLGRDRIFGVVLNGVDEQQQDDYSVYSPVT